MVFNQISVTVRRRVCETGAVARALLRMTARTTPPLTLEPQWLKQARSVYFEAVCASVAPVSDDTSVRVCVRPVLFRVLGTSDDTSWCSSRSVP